MKAILEFNLPEDQYDFQCANKGFDAIMIIDEVLSHLRDKIKYSEEKEDYIRACEELSEFIYNEMKERAVKLND